MRFRELRRALGLRIITGKKSGDGGGEGGGKSRRRIISKLDAIGLTRWTHAWENRVVIVIERVE